MNKLLIKIFLFISPIIIIGIGIEWSTRQIPNDYQKKNTAMLERAANIETLILGNSHTFYGVNPALFHSNTYNLAFLSQSVEYDYRLFSHYEAKLSKLHTLIVPISLFSLHSTMESDGCGWMIKNYNIYMNLNSSIEPKKNLELFSEKIRPILQKNYLYYFKDSTYCTSDLNGWSRRIGARKKHSIDTLSQEAFHRHFFDKSTYVKYNIDMLEKLILLAKKKQIKILFITTPTYHSYYQLAIETKQYKEVQDVLKLLVAKYSNCAYINSINDSRFEKDDFFDGDHLNEQGARKYSLFLDSLLQYK